MGEMYLKGLVMEDKEGNSFKNKTKEAEEHGGGTAYRVWFRSQFAIKVSCFLMITSLLGV